MIGKFQLLNPASLVAVAALALLCGDSMAHCAGNHTGDHPHCQGGGPGGEPSDELALDIEFRCSHDMVDRLCEPDGPDRVQGDGNKAFVDSIDDVTAVVTSNGTLLFGTGGTKKKGSIRQVFTDFTEGAGSSVPLTSGDVTTTDALAFPYRTKIQVNRRNTIEDLRDISVGQTAWLDMWLDVSISDGGSGSVIFLRFDSENANTECRSDGSQDVPVFRESDTRWIVDAPAGTVGCVFVLDRDQSNSGNKGDYVMGPFRFEFSAL